MSTRPASTRHQRHRRAITADRAARMLITIGGGSAIAAVLGIFLFLIWVALPLLLPGSDLYPLIFAACKATFCSILFGAPLALLAAVFTSEFLSGRARSVAKPTMEVMANLPSVALGFFTAMVFAPVVLDLLPPTWLADHQLVGDSPIQHNALIVGFAMGFAIIPTIYTLAEDALSAVPDHLRSASLAAGATPWQTAVRIIIPTASSGLISALLVGFGRVLGETMIVLMAVGTTPILEWDIVALEPPVATLPPPHEHTLFLAALALFLMTFVINTVAKMARLRFRGKVLQL